MMQNGIMSAQTLSIEVEPLIAASVPGEDAAASPSIPIGTLHSI
jgi:hypothetical protein